MPSPLYVLIFPPGKNNEDGMQLELFERDQIEADELSRIAQEFRAGYWQLRSMRGGRWAQAKQRQIYRRLAPLKQRLMLAGVEKQAILDFLSCCRLKCRCPGARCQYF